ncbi:MAG: hypothetical protein KBF74_03820 [Ferruginibacter sp.]|nr:hypothetical protein [Ferruginibacter sp.]
MKSLKFSISMLALATVLFTACKKDDSSNPGDEMAITSDLSSKQATTDIMVEDDNALLFSITDEENLSGGKLSGGGQTPSFVCATVTVTPASGFPKTITLDFGSGCTNPGTGVTRSGKMIFVLSDSLRHVGSTSVLTFDNYYVNGFKREGTITWTNVSTPGHRSWTRQVVAGKITAPSGAWWLHNALKTITQVQGMGTIIPADDAFETTGSGTVVNSNNVTRTYTVLEALLTKNICHHIVAGRLKVEGPQHYAIINYGNGACDNIATISIDGGNPFPIQLP